VTTPHFFAEIAALLVASAVVAYVGQRYKVMPIVSFLVTGAVIGPHALGLVRDEALVEGMAEVGVILLLFTIGIEFSLQKLARIKRIIFLGGGLQVLLVVGLVTAVLAAAGVDWRSGIYTGCLVALSSTAIVMKLLMERRDMATDRGEAALGILIFQDLAVVAMVLLVPMLGGGSGSALDVVLALAKAVGIVVLVIVVARRVMPPLLEAVARTCSQEIFLLSIIGICFGTAFLTSLAGVSLSLGAFLAGLVVSESKFSQVAFGEILPLQILFSAAFFLSVGLLFDVSYLMSHPMIILAAILGVLAVKVVTTSLGLAWLGYPAAAAVGAGLILAQIGEFSFVLERVGYAAGLYPMGSAEGGREAFIGATVALMVATPFLYGLADRLGGRRRRGARTPPLEAPTAPDAEDRHDGLRDHVIVAGLGVVGRSLAEALHRLKQPYVIMTLSPEGALEAERGELHVVRGNYTRQHELTRTGLRQARMLVVADDDLEVTRQVVAAARALHPALSIVARARTAHEADTLGRLGADRVIADEVEGGARLTAIVLEASEADAAAVETEREARAAPEVPGPPANRPALRAPLVLTEPQRTSGCAHVPQTTTVVPGADGCERCLETGDTWIHLRVCMTCGFVGCCDSSPNRHATKHFHETQHPIVRSGEPGEDWGWCYLDRMFL